MPAESWPSPVFAPLGELTIEEFLRAKGASPAAVRLLVAGFEQDSALDFLRDAWSHEAVGPEVVAGLWSTVARMRLTSSRAVVDEAEAVVRNVIEAYERLRPRWCNLVSPSLRCRQRRKSRNPGSLSLRTVVGVAAHLLVDRPVQVRRYIRT